MVGHRRTRTSRRITWPPEQRPRHPRPSPSPRRCAGRAPSAVGWPGSWRCRSSRCWLCSAVVVAGDVDSFRTSTQTTDSVELTLEVQNLVQELQHERGITSGLLGGNVGYKRRDGAGPRPGRRRAGPLSRLATGATAGAEGVRSALNLLTSLPAVRAQVDAGKVTRAAAFGYYTDRDLRVHRRGLRPRTAPPTRRCAGASPPWSRSARSRSRPRRSARSSTASSPPVGSTARSTSSSPPSTRRSRRRSAATAGSPTTPSARGWTRSSTPAPPARPASSSSVALAAGDGRRFVVDPQSWWSAQTTVLDDMREVAGVRSATTSRSGARDPADQRHAAPGRPAHPRAALRHRRDRPRGSGRAVDHPAAGRAGHRGRRPGHPPPARGGVAGAAAQSTRTRPGRPIRWPCRYAPAPRSGPWPTALDRVQATAYALATEQAMLRRSTTESLANLGRRNQNLLRRQLGFITQLEREEADPSGLANLFELDHLATRMRRNAESLLVLVGEASPAALVGSAAGGRRVAGGHLRGRGVPPGLPAPHRRGVRGRGVRGRARPHDRRAGRERAGLLAARRGRGDPGPADAGQVPHRHHRPGHRHGGVRAGAGQRPAARARRASSPPRPASSATTWSAISPAR